VRSLFRFFVTSMLGLLLVGCCFYRINRESFLSLTLDEKIQAYSDARRNDCLRQDGPLLLADIADHGPRALQAMETLLREPNRDFPPVDCLSVVLLAQAKGVKMEGAGLESIIRALGASKDPQIRWRAEAIVAIMEGRDPTPYMIQREKEP
jgi:hypothetical protein